MIAHAIGILFHIAQAATLEAEATAKKNEYIFPTL
jgi:hypothetical protein